MANNSNEDFVIKITADSADAEKKLDNVTKATQKVGNAAKSTGTQSQNLGKTLGGVAEAGSNVASAFGPAGSAIALAANAIRGLKAAMSGVAGGLTVVIGAVVGIFATLKQKVEEYDQKQEELRQKEKERLDEALQAKIKVDAMRLDNSVKELEREKAAADAATQANQNLLAAKRAMLSAEDQARFAQIDLEEQEGLIDAVGDPDTSNRVRQEANRKRAQLNYDIEGRKLYEGRNDIQTGIDQAEANKTAAIEELAKWDAEGQGYQKELADLDAQRQDYIDRRLVRNRGGLKVYYDKQVQDFFNGGYDRQRQDILARQAAYNDRRKNDGVDARTALQITNANSAIAVGRQNLQTQDLKIQTHETTGANLLSAQQALVRTQNSYAEQVKQEQEAQRQAQEQARQQREAEAQAQREAQRQARIEEAQGNYNAAQNDVAQLQAEHQQVNGAYAAGQQRVQLLSRRLTEAQKGSGGRTDADQIKAAARALGEARKELVALSKAAESFNASYAKRLQKEEDEAAKALQRLNAARESK